MEASTELSCNVISVCFNPCSQIYSACVVSERGQKSGSAILLLQLIVLIYCFGKLNICFTSAFNPRFVSDCSTHITTTIWYLFPPCYHLLLSYLLNGVQILSCSGASSLFYFSCKVQFAICHTEGLVWLKQCSYVAWKWQYTRARINAPRQPGGWYVAQPCNLSVPPVQLRKASSSITLCSPAFHEWQWRQGLSRQRSLVEHTKHTMLLWRGSQVYSVFSRLNREGVCALCSGSDDIKSDSICSCVHACI